MQSVDGDVRLSVKLDTKTIQSSAEELKNAFKNALKTISGTDELGKNLQGFTTAINAITDSVKALQDAIKTTNTAIPTAEAAPTGTTSETTDNAERTEQAVEETTKATEQATNAAVNFGNAFSSNKVKVDTTASTALQLANNIQIAENKVADLNRQIESLSAQKNTAEEYQELAKFLEQAEKDLEAANQKQLILTATAGRGSEVWKENYAEITAIKQAIAETKTEMQELEKNGKAFKVVDNSEKITKLNEQLTIAENQLDIARKRAEEFQTALDATQAENIVDTAQETSDSMNTLVTSETQAQDSTNELQNALTAASSKITAFRKSVLNSVRALIEHAKASKSANNGLNDFNKIFKKGIGLILRYGLGIRSTYVLINKLRSAVKEGYKNLAGYSDEVNKSISSVLSSTAKLKNQLAATFQPIVSVVVPILNSLIAKLTQAMAVVSQFFAAWSGQQIVYKANDTQKQYVENLEDTAEAAKEAEKALENYLSPLDDINRYEDKTNTAINTDNVNGDSTDTGLFEIVEVENRFKILVDKIKKYLNEMFKPIKAAWNKYGKQTINAVKRTFVSLLGVINAVRKSFETVWTNGTGQEIVEKALQTFININNIISAIADNLKTAWNSGSGLKIAQKIGDTYKIILNHIEKITSKTAGWAQDVNFESLLNSLDKILAPLQKIIDLAGTWAENVWQKVFLPLAEWAIEEAVPAALNAIAGALELINSVGEKAGEILGALWDGFFAQAASWVGDKIVSFLEFLGQILTDVANNDTAVTTIIAIGAAVLTIVTAIETLNAALAIADILSQPLLILPELIATAIAAIIVVIIEIITYWDTLKEIFSEGIQWWKDFFSKWWNTIISYWSDKLLEIGKWFKTVIASFKEFIGDVKTYWENLFKNLWNSVKNWWNNTFISGWKSALATVKSTFSGMWNGIKNIAKNAINAVIGWINTLISGIVSKINHVLSLMNNLSFDIPDWLGGGTLGFNVPLISAPQIPYLATGAVIPPNREFLAVLGDQKAGNNIETPESLLRQIVREETAQRNGKMEVVAQVGRRELFRIVLDEAMVQMGQTGRNPFDLG